MSALPPIKEAANWGGLRRGPPVQEVWTNRGRVLRRLGEPNAGRGYGSHRLGAVPQSALHDGSSLSHDLLRAFRTAYRSDTHVRPATFGTLRIPPILSDLCSNDAAKIAQIQKVATPDFKRDNRRPEGVKTGRYGFGSKADMTRSNCDVCSYTESRLPDQQPDHASNQTERCKDCDNPQID